MGDRHGGMGNHHGLQQQHGNSCQNQTCHNYAPHYQCAVLQQQVTQTLVAPEAGWDTAAARQPVPGCAGGLARWESAQMRHRRRLWQGRVGEKCTFIPLSSSLSCSQKTDVSSLEMCSSPPSQSPTFAWCRQRPSAGAHPELVKQHVVRAGRGGRRPQQHLHAGM